MTSDIYSLKDKSLCTFSYLSFGILGFILLILGQANGHFIRFNIFQSILLGLLYLLIREGVFIIIRIFIFLVKAAPNAEIYTKPVISFAQTLDQFLFYGLILGIFYCVFFIWRSKYPWIKCISSQIDKML